MNWQKYNNPAGYLAAVNLLLCFAQAVAYAFQRDWRRASYYFFAFCITVTVVY
jgi:hypothetical protein